MRAQRVHKGGARTRLYRWRAGCRRGESVQRVCGHRDGLRATGASAEAQQPQPKPAPCLRLLQRRRGRGDAALRGGQHALLTLPRGFGPCCAARAHRKVRAHARYAPATQRAPRARMQLRARVRQPGRCEGVSGESSGVRGCGLLAGDSARTPPPIVPSPFTRRQCNSRCAPRHVCV